MKSFIWECNRCHKLRGGGDDSIACKGCNSNDLSLYGIVEEEADKKGYVVNFADGSFPVKEEEKRK